MLGLAAVLPLLAVIIVFDVCVDLFFGDSLVVIPVNFVLGSLEVLFIYTIHDNPEFLLSTVYV